MRRELAGTRPAWRVAWRAAISVMSVRDLYGGRLLGHDCERETPPCGVS